MAGTAGAQVIQFGATFALARLLTPTVFGDVAVFIGYATILTSIVGLKLELNIQLQKDDHDSWRFARTTLLVAAPVTIIASLLLMIAAMIGLLPGSQAWHFDWWVALPLNAWLGVAANVATAWHIRHGHFSKAARLRFLMAISIAILQICAAGLGLGATGQIWAATLGIAAGLIGSHFTTIARRRPLSLSRFIERSRWNEARACVIEWRKHSANLVLAALAGTAAWQIPTLLLHHFWGADAAGYYSLAFRLSMAPLGLAYSAISEVSYRETTLRIQTGADLLGYMRRATLGLFAGGALVSGVIAFAAPWFISPLFGSKWIWVDQLLPWMMLPLAFRLAGTGISLFTQTGRTGWLLAWQCCFLVVHTLCFLTAHIAELSLESSIAVAALVQSLFYLAMIFANFAIVRHTSPFHDRSFKSNP